MAVTVWACKICGEAYISELMPSRCPFCGAYEKYLIDSKEYDDTGDWDVELNETDKANVEKALELEISNTLFYKCSAKKVKEIDGKMLFKILAKVESEHASVWKKILKLDEVRWEPAETCDVDYEADLEESHAREEKAIKFYGEAATTSTSPRVKEIFQALVQVETDHLHLSEQRLK